MQVDARQLAGLEKVFNRPADEKSGCYQTTRFGDHVIISGCVSRDPEGRPLHAGDLPSQVEAVYAGIDATLKAHGMGAVDVVQETIFTSDLIGFASANDKRLEFYRDVTPPASTWVRIRRLVHPAVFLEVEVTACSKR
jgi:2-iminobutanoate/2-iminopropanoate deaminase